LSTGKPIDPAGGAMLKIGYTETSNTIIIHKFDFNPVSRDCFFNCIEYA